MKNKVLAVDSFEISSQKRAFINRTTQRPRDIEYKDFDITFTTGDEENKQVVTTIRLNEGQALDLITLIDDKLREE